MNTNLLRFAAKPVGLFFLVALLAGCGTTTESSVSVPITQQVVVPSVAGENHIGMLSPQTLAAGECGLFLWSRSSERNLIMFNGRDGMAHMVINGQSVKFPRLQAEGEQILGQFEKQTFQQSPYTLYIEVKFEKRAGISRGAVVPQGSLRMVSEGGWEVIVPIGGLVACEGR